MFTKMERDALNVILPASTTSITVPSAASTTAGVAGQILTALRGEYVWMKASAKVHIRSGSTPTAAGAATAGDMYLNADQDYYFRVPLNGNAAIRVYGAAAGTLYYARSSNAD